MNSHKKKSKKENSVHKGKIYSTMSMRKNNLFEENKKQAKKTFQYFGSISTFNIRAGIASG